MSYFKNVCLLKSPQKIDAPYALTISDLTEICYLAGMVNNDVDRNFQALIYHITAFLIKTTARSAFHNTRRY